MKESLPIEGPDVEQPIHRGGAESSLRLRGEWANQPPQNLSPARPPSCSRHRL